MPADFQDRCNDTPRIHWTGLTIREEYWLSEDIASSGVYLPAKNSRRHPPANRTAQKSKSKSQRPYSTPSVSSSSCVPANSEPPKEVTAPRSGPERATQSANSTPSVSLSLCLSGNPQPTAITFPRSNPKYETQAPMIQEYIEPRQQVVQVPDVMLFEQEYAFTGNARGAEFERNVYPGGSDFGFLDQSIGNAEPEREWGPWTVEDERMLTEILAQY